MPTSKLSSKGQTVIPKSIREHLGVGPGDEVDFIVRDDGEVVIRPATIDVEQLFGLLDRPGQKPVSVEEMNQAIRNRFGRHDRS